MTAAISGANYLGARSFVVAFTTSTPSSSTGIAAGSYYLVTDFDCDGLITTANNAYCGGLGSVTSQPAAGSENRLFYLPAGAMVPLDVLGTSYLSFKGLAASGTVRVIGPVREAPIS